MPGQFGNPGGGRKSAYAEKSAADLLKANWSVPQVIEELKARVQSGKYSLSDIFYLKAFGGNDKLLNECFRKLHPELHDLTTNGKDLPTPIITVPR